MDTFGLGDAAKYIGTPQTIAIRNPDCAVATHLMSLVGTCKIKGRTYAKVVSTFLNKELACCSCR